MHLPRLAIALAALALLALSALAPAASAKGGKADLVVAKLSKPPKSKAAGAKLALVVKVANKGAAPAGKSKLAVYLAKGKKPGKRDKLLKQARVKPLLPGRTARLKLKLHLPAGADGSYRLVACADSKHQVTEASERDNCRASRKLTVVAEAAPPSPSPTPAAAPAFTATDQYEWGKGEDAEGEAPSASRPIVATLRAADGLPGAAGYTRSELAPAPLAGGTATTLSFSNGDDGQVPVLLPFAFPFGGIAESTALVGTNGWIGFGTSPALDYYPHSQVADYRGLPTAFGDFFRGVFPYWGDLSVDDQGHGPGSVREVVPADGSYVAFQWQVSLLGEPAAPVRTFQVVLYPDGRFRLDYPGANEAGGYESFIGYSLGTGAASSEIVTTKTADVPASSFLFTPNPVSQGPLPAGTATLTLPSGSTLVEAPGCSLTQAPTALTDGAVDCSLPGLAPGQQEQRTVSFMLPNAPGYPEPEDVKFAGSYRSGAFSLTDNDELNSLDTYLEPTTLEVEPTYQAPIPTHVGTPSTFRVGVGDTPSSGLDQPRLTLTLPTNATFVSADVESDPAICGPVSGGSVTCKLPSGMLSRNVYVTVNPTATGTMSLGATVEALNAATVSATASSPSVEP